MSFRYDTLKDSIVNVIKDIVEGNDVGIAFSGGLDSGLVSAISKKYANSVTLYTTGTTNAYDVLMAKDLSERLEIPWVHVRLSKGNVDGYIREMIVATDTTDPFTIAYELPLFGVCKVAEEDHIITGQGADEYFMGCAKFVGRSDADYETLKEAAVKRLLEVSVPCEKRIASYFKKDLLYPYLDRSVISEIEKVDSADLRPADMDSRKSVLKEVALDMGYAVLAERKKKSSQYGSGTMNLIKSIAREEGKQYNEYIARISGQVLSGITTKRTGSVINARIDSIVKLKAEDILQQQGISPSEVIEMLYNRIIEDNDIRSIKNP